MNHKHIGFKKGRQLSNIFYTIAGIFLVYRVMLMENSDPLALVVLGIGIAFFCVGMVIYSKFCRCPKCGLLQPRYIRNSCEHCKTPLD